MPSAPKPTVAFDQYCGHSQEVFPEVRSFEPFEDLHLGMMAELPRKTLPALARVVGWEDAPPLPHVLATSPWEVATLRATRLQLGKQVVHDRPIVRCREDTGAKNKGQTTAYVARQYLGHLGKMAQGMVCVNADGIPDALTFPWRFQGLKPRTRWHAGEQSHANPQMAIQRIHALKQMGFHFEVVLADRLYGESGDFIEAWSELKLRFAVASRENPGVLLPPGPRIRSTTWREVDRIFSNGDTATRGSRQIVSGQRRAMRYDRLTTGDEEQPPESTWVVMTNLAGARQQDLGHIDGLRTWREDGVKQSTNELGWADFRLTEDKDLEKGWELVSRA